MEFLKKLCVVVVLAALSYSAYATLTTRPPADAPPEAEGTDTLVAVDVPPISMPAPSATTPTAPNNASAAPAFSPSAAPSAPAFNSPAAASPAPAFNPSAAAPAPTAPGTLPSVPMPLPITPSPKDSSMMTSPASPATSLPGVSISTHDDGTAPVAVVTGIDTNPANLDPLGDFRADYTESQNMLRRGDLGGALRVLSPWFEDERLPAAEREPLIELLDQLAGTVVYSRDYELEPAYMVQPGDTLESIADRYEVPPKLLANINGLPDAQTVRPGDKLKVVRGPFNALVDLTNYQLTLVVQGHYAGRFRIGLGTDLASDFTASGQTLEVLNKVEDPPYYGKNAVVDADDPNNPLGGYWIELGNKVGIHGTNDPRLIGRTEGMGAIRLSSRDIADVYNILSKKSKVVIHR